MHTRYDPTTSPSLILRIRDSGDTTAWETFESTYAPVVRVYCRRRRIQEADIEDLVQDVMTTLMRAIRSFDYDPARGRFRAWFGTLTANRVCNYFVSKSQRQKDTVFHETYAAQSATSSAGEWDSIFCQRVLKVACERIQSRLQPATWESFKLTWLQNLPAAEASEQLGLPIHAIYVNKSRVIKLLESEVRSLADDFPSIEFRSDSIGLASDESP
jgi:RNA polymerase sigma-70 factor, ECF subfamily